jgi:hypothetical protein
MGMTLLAKWVLGGEILGAGVAACILASLAFRLLHRIMGTSDSRPQTPDNIQAAMARANNESRAHRWLDAFDIFLNVTFMNGQNDETMSAHAWRASLEGRRWGVAMNWWLDGFQPNHGYQAACGDLQRARNRVECESKALGLK